MAAVGARQTPLTCSGHTRPVVDLTFSPITEDGFFLVAASKDSNAILRNGKTGDWLGTFDGHKGAVWGATINATATLCASGAADFSAKVWDAITGDEVHAYSHPHIVKAVEFSKNSEQLLTGCNDKVVRLWDVSKPDAAVVEMSGHTGLLKKVLFSPDEKTVISGGDDKKLQFWDVRSGEKTRTIDLGSPLTGLEISQDGATLTATYGTKIDFYNADTMELKKSKTVESPVYTASLHPDGKTFVWGGMDNLLHVCDYETMNQQEEYKGHFGPVHCVRYSPDGEVYASGSEDGTVRLWQTRVGIEYGLWRFTKTDDGSDSAPAS